MTDLYQIMKGKTYDLACIASARTNSEARTEGFKDVYDLIMSDSDNYRQFVFLSFVTQTLAEGHRRILLDGMAKEYAGLEG